MRSFVIGCMLAASAIRASASVIAINVDSAHVGEAVVEYVAEVAPPILVEVKQGQTLGQVITDTCGRVIPAYVQLLKQQQQLEVLDLDAPLPATRRLQLPACLELPAGPELETVRVERGDSPWAFYKEDSAGLDPKEYLRTFARHNARFRETRIILEGERVIVPRSPEVWSSLTLSPDVQVDVQNVGRRLQQLLVQSGQAPETARWDAGEEGILYTAVPEDLLQQLGACQLASEAALPEPFDLPRLLEVLSFGVRTLRSRGFRPLRAVIVIPDTGLTSATKLPFTPDRIRPIKTKVQYDQTPTEIFDGRHHGSQVATLALGGPHLMQLSDVINLDIDVAPINLVRIGYPGCRAAPDCQRPWIDLAALNNLFDDIEKNEAIVNLSVGRSKPFPELAKQLTDSSDSLFLVAAGNDSKSLLERSVYPARYGGAADKPNLLTIAALDLDGKTISAFSNHGAHYVDLGAPGCLLPALQLGAPPNDAAYHVRQVSGTSFAAPLVSFTAALLKAVWLDVEPYQIKKRLLTSADVVTSLDQAIRGGRVLNSTKAVAVYQDVVEVSDASGRKQLLLGTLSPEHTMFSFCGGTLSLRRTPNEFDSVLKKIVRISPNEFRVVWETPEGLLDEKSCPKPDFDLRLTEDFTGGTRVISFENVVDVVLAEESRAIVQ